MPPAIASPFRAELGATLRLAGPLALANLLQMAIYATDVLFIARLGTEPLAAASLSTSVFGQMVWTFSGLTGAVAPLIAAELGRMRHAVREVRRSVRMALWLSVLCGIVGMAVCMFGEAIMLAAGQDAAVAARAGSFLALLAWSMAAPRRPRRSSRARCRTTTAPWSSAPALLARGWCRRSAPCPRAGRYASPPASGTRRVGAPSRRIMAGWAMSASSRPTPRASVRPSAPMPAAPCWAAAA